MKMVDPQRRCNFPIRSAQVFALCRRQNCDRVIAVLGVGRAVR